MQLPSVFIRHSKQFTAQILNHQARHEVFGGVLLRKNEKDGRLFRSKLLCIDGAVEAKHLLQFRVQKCIETRKYRGHDRGHGLFCAVECSTSKPSGLVVWRQLAHQELEVTLALYFAGFQQILHQLEDRNDVPALLWMLLIRRQKLRQHQDD